MNNTTKNEIANRAKAFMFELLMEHPGVTAQDISSVLGSVASNGSGSNGQSSAASNASPAASPKKKLGRPAKKGVTPSAVNQRTEAGRAAYDKTVLDAFASLGGKNLAARHLRASVGGTPTQLRASLDRLIEAKRLTFSGERAGTRYSVR